VSELSEKQTPAWQPIPAIERRILGVLVEKAKTTPDVYPMSLSGICTGANQKNNRFPLFNLTTDDLESPLEDLRAKGAVILIEGSGRVQKYRHVLYEWLGVDKVELAVMTELLLRGAQTEGELRGRAARMEPIADVAALRPVLESLQAKKLIVSLTPAGRGHTLTHALYLPRELEKVRADANIQRAQSTGAQFEDDAVPATRATAPPAPRPASVAQAPTAPRLAGDSSDLPAKVRELTAACADLREMHETLALELQSCRQEIAQLKRDLGA
jgi:uncharacterized protein YceH (UPF0502 family)